MNYLLFTTETCPKCPEVKKFVKNNIIFNWDILNNTNHDFMEKAQKYWVSQAPTFIIFDWGNEIFRGNEVSEIEDFLS